MSDTNEMLVRIERAIDYFEKHTDDLGMPIFLGDIAKVLTEAQKIEMMLREANSKLINHNVELMKRAEAAETSLKHFGELHSTEYKAMEARAEAAEKREAALRVVMERIAKESMDYQYVAQAALEAKP